MTDRTAAVLLEPIQGESGVHELPAELLRAARAACDRVGAALVFDEVQTGLGRTGTLWAYEWTGVVPDALTMAKALAGGLPMGALITGERLSGVLVPGDHGSTFAGGPVVAAAAHAALDVLAEPQLLARVTALGERLREALRELPGVTAVRGRGLMVAADIASLGAGGRPARAARAAAGHQRDRPGDAPLPAAADRGGIGRRRRRGATRGRPRSVIAARPRGGPSTVPAPWMRRSTSPRRPRRSGCASCWSRTTTATR